MLGSRLTRRCLSGASRSDLLAVSREVAQALHEGRPVVALESTIISHGMPYPQNLETARRVEQAVRQAGSTPATVAVLGGRVRVGLTDAELEAIARAGPRATKTSRRDLPWVLARKNAIGSTTVSGTVVAAHLAGIRVLATGGLGGVHRGAQDSMDVSADLTELGRTPVAVVCAGVKSILDIGRTLEYLETQGVAVVTLGRTRDFPAFYKPRSGFLAPYATDDVGQIAAMLNAQHALGLTSGAVVAVPIPEEDAAMGVDLAIQQALADAEARGMRGADITPFVLHALNQLTDGAALRANIALVLNNARRGSELAVAMAGKPPPKTHANTHANMHASAAPSTPQPLVVGGVLRDLTARAHQLVRKSSAPGTVKTAWGGVGRNVAAAMRMLGARPVFVTAVGDDETGRQFLQHWSGTLGLSCDGVMTSQGSTSTYVAVHDETGDLDAAVVDTVVIDGLTADVLQASARIGDRVRTASFVVLDANLPVSAMKTVVAECWAADKPFVFEPTSVAKCSRLAQAARMLKPLRAACDLITPNEHELCEMVYGPNVKPDHWDARAVATAATRAIDIGFAPVVLVKRGARGAMLVARPGADQAPVVLSQPSYVQDPSEIRSVTGAGDSMVAAFALALYRDGRSLDDALRIGLKAAALSVRSDEAVSPLMSPELLQL